MSFRGVRLGVPICEDIWTDWGDYENVVECLAETGAELLLVPNGSPYWRDKEEVRLNIAVARVTESELPMIYVNQIGGQATLEVTFYYKGISISAQPTYRTSRFTYFNEYKWDNPSTPGQNLSLRFDQEQQLVFQLLRLDRPIAEICDLVVPAAFAS